MYIGVLAFFLMAVIAPGALGARPKMDSDKVILERRFEDMRWIKLNAVVLLWMNLGLVLFLCTTDSHQFRMRRPCVRLCYKIFERLTCLARDIISFDLKHTMYPEGAATAVAQAQW